MWKVLVKRKDQDEEEFEFASRPTLSEGPSLFRLFGDQEGELWMPSADIDYIRCRAPEQASTRI